MKAQKAVKQIALIKTGGTIPDIRERYGDFESWFTGGLGVPDLLQVDVYKNESLPDPLLLCGIVITGSPAMVSHREDWSEHTAAWLADVVKLGLPILGVCYGHQLLAHALGGRVGPNPNGRQIGTVQAELTKQAEKDPLLGYLTSPFAAQTSHMEVVLEPPQASVRLATSPLDDNFALRFTPTTWGLQYHPEFSADVMTGYIRCRAEALLDEGLDPEKLAADVDQADEAHQVLKRFIRLIDSRPV